MEGLGLREGDNATRAGRLKKLKKGPGVFVYNGSGVVTHYMPTPKLAGKNEPLLDSEGMPVIDAGGRQVFKPVGQIITNEDGTVKLGGVPKQVKHKIEVYKLRGVEFPEGEKVEVSNSSLALKLRCLPCFDEIEDEEVEFGEDGQPVVSKPKRKKAAKS